jgi:uncharacterized protein YndB with AHSA1/START domain
MTPILAKDERTIPFLVGEVWNVLANIEAYPNWWPRSVGLRVLSSEREIVGSSFELRPLGGRPFRCRIQSIESPSKLRLHYFGGFIEGRGEWRLESSGPNTQVQYLLDVQAAGRVVAFIGRLLPLNRIHSYQMKQVLRNLETAVKQQSLSRAQ